MITIVLNKVFVMVIARKILNDITQITNSENESGNSVLWCTSTDGAAVDVMETKDLLWQRFETLILMTQTDVLPVAQCDLLNNLLLNIIRLRDWTLPEGYQATSV